MESAPPVPTPDASCHNACQMAYAIFQNLNAQATSTLEILFAVCCILVFLAAIVAVVTAYRVHR